MSVACRRTSSLPAAERGSAIIVALLTIVLLNGIGLGLVTLANTEVQMAANFREAAESFYAADAAADLAVSLVSRASSWSDVLSGARPSSFRDGTMSPVLPSGEPLDLAALTGSLQRTSDAEARRGANNPRWQLFLFRPLAAIARSAFTRQYVIAWVADDPTEIDDDPLADSNGIVTIRAQAIGRQGRQRAIEATVAKRDIGLDVLSWREIR